MSTQTLRCHLIVSNRICRCFCTRLVLSHTGTHHNRGLAFLNGSEFGHFSLDLRDRNDDFFSLLMDHFANILMFGSRSAFLQHGLELCIEIVHFFLVFLVKRCRLLLLKGLVLLKSRFQKLFLFIGINPCLLFVYSIVFVLICCLIVTTRLLLLIAIFVTRLRGSRRSWLFSLFCKDLVHFSLLNFFFLFIGYCSC